MSGSGGDFFPTDEIGNGFSGDTDECFGAAVFQQSLFVWQCLMIPNTARVVVYLAVSFIAFQTKEREGAKLIEDVRNRAVSSLAIHDVRAVCPNVPLFTALSFQTRVRLFFFLPFCVSSPSALANERRHPV